MTSKIIAQSDRQQKSDKPQESGILQRVAVRPVSDAGMQSTDNQEELALSNSAFSKDFSRVPISTTKPQQFQPRNSQSHLMQPIQAKLTIEEPGDRVIQRKGEMTGNSQVSSEVSRPNKTGLPDRLKTGIENLSGYSMDNVRVHYNSDKPAQLQAHAYAQGTDIHIATGQEKHLRHEAWHVVQKMQGRVKPTMQMKGVEINDEQGLEREADVMGARAGVWGNLAPASQKAALRVVLDSSSQNAKQEHGSDSSKTNNLSFPVAGVIQRRIVRNMLAFNVNGRLLGHDSPANKRALSAKIRLRWNQGGANNNNYENNLMANVGVGGAQNFIGGNLRARNYAICHKMSSKEVQQRVAEAGNQPNLGQFDAIIDPMRNAIAVPAWANQALDFQNKAQANFNQATNIANIQGIAANRTALGLTQLASAIANSPVNFFIGIQTTNAAISNRGDFNSYEPPGALALANQRQRRMTPDSNNLYAAMNAGLHPNMRPFSALEGINAGPNTLRNQWAQVVSNDIQPLVPAAQLPQQLDLHFFLSSSAALGAGGTGYAWI